MLGIASFSTSFCNFTFCAWIAYRISHSLAASGATAAVCGVSGSCEKFEKEYEEREEIEAVRVGLLQSNTFARVRNTRRQNPGTHKERWDENGKLLDKAGDIIPAIAIYHIGKTGGTSLRNTLENCTDPDKVVFLGHGESQRLSAIRINASTEAPAASPSKDIVFYVRSPVHRFTSAWIEHYKWKCDPALDEVCAQWEETEYTFRTKKQSFAKEHGLMPNASTRADNFSIAIRAFPTPDELACSLSSDDAEKASMAKWAMDTLSHVHHGLSYSFGGIGGLKTLEAQILFVGRTEHMDDDYERLKTLLEAKDSFIHDPPANVLSEQRTFDSPELKMLGTCAVLNLHRYYAEDYQIIHFLVEQGLLNASYFDEVIALDMPPPVGQRLSF